MHAGFFGKSTIVSFGALRVKAYCEVLYPLWMVDSLRASKVHHCLPLVTIGCP